MVKIKKSWKKPSKKPSKKQRKERLKKYIQLKEHTIRRMQEELLRRPIPGFMASLVVFKKPKVKQS